MALPQPDVVVLGRFPPPVDGQSLATRRVAALLEDRHRVCRIDTSPPGDAVLPAEPTVRLDRLRHYWGQRQLLRRLLRSAPTAPVLWTSISPARLGHWRDVLTVLPHFGPGQPVYAVVHRATFGTLFSDPVTAATAYRVARRVQGFVFLNEPLSAACAPYIPADKRFVIPNTIDDVVVCTPEETEGKRQARGTQRSLRLLFLGNMLSEKGYQDVLEAVRLLRDRGRPAQAAFAGAWLGEDQRAAFENFVREKGLQNLVRHAGPVTDRSEVRALHLEADVFLLPTYHPTEAQPLSIIEALNAGTPVVTTRQGGIPEMVREDEEAFFVPPRSPEAIADAVQSLADVERWRRMSGRARNRFETVFSPEIVRSQWLALVARHLPCNLPSG